MAMKDLETIIGVLNDINLRWASPAYIPTNFMTFYKDVEDLLTAYASLENHILEIGRELSDAGEMSEELQLQLERMRALSTASRKCLAAFRVGLGAFAAKLARAGDPQLLIDCINLGFPTDTEELRPLFKLALKGELKRPNNRPAKFETHWRSREMGRRVQELHEQGMTIESAVAQVAEEFGVSGQTVRRGLKQSRSRNGLL
jgi:hypothetical protein